jgi:hypothetical protein
MKVRIAGVPTDLKCVPSVYCLTSTQMCLVSHITVYVILTADLRLCKVTESTYVAE